MALVSNLVLFMNAITFRRLCHPAALALSVLLLASCGGSGDTTPATLDKANSTDTGSATQRQTPGAAINAVELAAAEKAAVAAEASGSSTALDELKEGQIAAKSAYVSGEVARKAVAVRIPVYRFSNSATGAHFFTTSTTERDNVIATMSPPYSHEGEAFSVASAFSPGLSPVHRFYNTRTGVHFYTISESERATVAASLPQFLYEGVAYHASQVAGQGLIPFYRFYVPSRGFHFYTADEAEKASVIANLSATYSYEGIGYYVLDTNWTAEKLPHSGITDQQCYQAGGNALVACSASAATDLNAQQDGHRVAVNPMSYSAVPIPSRGGLLLHPFTDCVRDNVTGLLWEGKTDDGGLRDKDNRYTNLGNGVATDASGYVAAVNAVQLCGYSDWRLPTMRELSGIVHFGTANPSVSGTGFPNTLSDGYWSLEALSTDSTQAWAVDFTEGLSYTDSRSATYPVRLVRGNAPGGVRFTYSTVVYGSDAANNVVNDAWTGLQWRRCEEGRVWSGSGCTGSASGFTHEQALGHARSQSGWRMPNVKELASLTDLSVGSGAVIDPTAFPGADDRALWSTTPPVGIGLGYGAWGVNSGSGYVGTNLRSLTYAVRLVRAGQ